MSAEPVAGVSFPAYGAKGTINGRENRSLPEVLRQQAGKPAGDRECRTCAARRYVDASADPAVSMKSPTRLPPGAEAAAVMAHEREHLAHDREKAEREGRKVVYQTVQIFTGVCPECGRVYVSGGRAITVTRPRSSFEEAELGKMVTGRALYARWSEWKKAKEEAQTGSWLSGKESSTLLHLDRVV